MLKSNEKKSTFYYSVYYNVFGLREDSAKTVIDCLISKFCHSKSSVRSEIRNKLIQIAIEALEDAQADYKISSAPNSNWEGGFRTLMTAYFNHTSLKEALRSIESDRRVFQKIRDKSEKENFGRCMEIKLSVFDQLHR